MGNNDLKQKFEVTGKTARDFIRWAAEKGVKVHDATVSRHLAGTQGITGPWFLAYDSFFSLLLSGSATDFEVELYRLVNRHIDAGLSKPDLIHKMEYVTRSCQVS
jgi:hypothetical protein